MDTQLATALSEIQRTLGRIESSVETQVKNFEAHVASDKLMAADISALQLSQARQRGFIAGITAVATAIGSMVAVIAHKLLSHQ